MHDAELPEEITEIMFAELTDPLATTIENLEVALRLPPGVEAELYGTAAVNRDAEGCEILAGSMIAGGVRRMVVKLTVPAGKADDTLAVAVTARWKTPGEEAGRKASRPAGPGATWDSARQSPASTKSQSPCRCPGSLGRRNLP